MTSPTASSLLVWHSAASPGRRWIPHTRTCPSHCCRRIRRTASDGDRTFLDAILDKGLTPTVHTDYERWEPLHWIVEVPDVMERGGFDAVIGNPPFLGGKRISTALGGNFREWLVQQLASGQPGNADLVAYFFLRAWSLAEVTTSQLGLLGTNTLGQGDTREVGLERLVHAGMTIRRATQSAPWPSRSANLEYAVVWGSRRQVDPGVPRYASGVETTVISALLEPEGRVQGAPRRLLENKSRAFIGTFVLGLGFIVPPQTARAWIKESPANQDVLRPYLTGDDVNSGADAEASRWAIDFGEMSEAEARRYRLPWRHVEQHVKPERLTKDARKYPRMVNEWWKYWNARPGLYSALASLSNAIVISAVSKHVQPVRVPTGQVLSHRLVVFPDESLSLLAVLASSVHELWARKWSSTLETRLNYSPSDVVDTLPFPTATPALEKVGEELLRSRAAASRVLRGGLTTIYNAVNDPQNKEPAVTDLRSAHEEIDRRVLAALGWGDLRVMHGFHTFRQVQRFTLAPGLAIEVLDRLLDENHRRADDASGRPL